MYIKLVPETVHYLEFIKFYLQSFVSVICLESSTKVLSENSTLVARIPSCMIYLTYFFSFSSVIATFEATSFIK